MWPNGGCDFHKVQKMVISIDNAHIKNPLLNPLQLFSSENQATNIRQWTCWCCVSCSLTFAWPRLVSVSVSGPVLSREQTLRRSSHHCQGSTRHKGSPCPDNRTRRNYFATFELANCEIIIVFPVIFAIRREQLWLERLNSTLTVFETWEKVTKLAQKILNSWRKPIKMLTLASWGYNIL